MNTSMRDRVDDKSSGRELSNSIDVLTGSGPRLKECSVCDHGAINYSLIVGYTPHVLSMVRSSDGEWK